VEPDARHGNFPPPLIPPQVPLRPTFDFLAELQLVTDLPVLVGIDGWNLMRGMATSRHWQKPTPLHASELLVPSILGTLDYGAGMANGAPHSIFDYLLLLLGLSVVLLLGVRTHSPMCGCRLFLARSTTAPGWPTVRSISFSITFDVFLLFTGVVMLLGMCTHIPTWLVPSILSTLDNGAGMANGARLGPFWHRLRSRPPAQTPPTPGPGQRALSPVCSSQSDIVSVGQAWACPEMRGPAASANMSAGPRAHKGDELARTHPAGPRPFPTHKV
jgi:hypothetical protein